MKCVNIYTDGSCLGNPGYGGWGAVLIYKDKIKEYSGYVKDITTNNRMELLAVIEALTLLKEPCKVIIHSDSSYVVNSVENNYLKLWIAKGWKTSSKKPVSNSDLWMKLSILLEKHTVTFKKVLGHNGIPLNELADTLANKQAKYIKSISI